jgi:hypothetical protein
MFTSIRAELESIKNRYRHYGTPAKGTAVADVQRLVEISEATLIRLVARMGRTSISPPPVRGAEPAACPVCNRPGGFHDSVIHGQHDVPRELIKPKDWHKVR